MASKSGQYEKENHRRKSTSGTNGNDLRLNDRHSRSVHFSNAKDHGLPSGIWRYDESSPTGEVDYGFTPARIHPQTTACIIPYTNQVRTILRETEIALKVIHMEGKVAINAYRRPNFSPRHHHGPKSCALNQFQNQARVKPRIKGCTKNSSALSFPGQKMGL